MSQQPSKSLTPSKTFLFGEYAVLFGGRAYVLAHGPFFSESDTEIQEVHEKSPAGKFLVENGMSLDLSLKDPHLRKGGFGRSTAEFVQALRKADCNFSLREAYEKYLSFFKDQRVKPSGADLLVQLSGKSAVVTKEPYSFEAFNWPFQDISILICHTNNKVETHEHLNRDLFNLDFTELRKISDRAYDALSSVKFNDFLGALKAFSSEQERLGLLHSHSIEVVETLNGLSDVYFARGCGAFGADVVAIFINEDIKTQSLSLALKELNLDLVYRI